MLGQGLVRILAVCLGKFTQTSGTSCSSLVTPMVKNLPATQETQGLNSCLLALAGGFFFFLLTTEPPITYPKIYFKIKEKRTSLVVEWIGVRLSMQGTRIRSLFREDPTCHGTTKVRVPKLLKPVCLEPHVCSKRSQHMRSLCTPLEGTPCSLQLEKSCRQQQRPSVSRHK